MSPRVRRPFLVAVVVTLALVLTACSSAHPTAAKKRHSSGTTTTVSASKGSATTNVPATSTSAPGTFKLTLPSTTAITTPADFPGATLVTVMGVGRKTSAPFTVPGGTKEWDVHATFSCSAGKTSAVTITVVDADTGETDGTDKVTRTATATSAQITGRYHDAGHFVLRITGSCYWIVSAFFAPNPAS